MSKQVIKNYTFNTSAKTVTLTDFNVSQPVLLERLALITDTTTNQVLYNFADSSIATATVSSNNVITLSALPGGVANGDKLRIDYNTVTNDPSYDAAALASNAAQETGGNLATIATNTTQTPNTIGATGSAVPSKSVQVGGSDGTNLRTLKTNTSGQLDIRPLTSSDQITVANASPLLVTNSPGTATGWTPYSNTALSNAKQSVKSSAGTLGGYMVFNPNAATSYIQVFDLASASVTVGTTTPTYTIAIPAGSMANIEFGNGILHSSAIVIAATTTATNSTAPSTALNVTILYK